MVSNTPGPTAASHGTNDGTTSSGAAVAVGPVVAPDDIGWVREFT